MKKCLLSFLTMACGMSLSAALPTVSNVTLSQNVSGDIAVTYDLSGANAIVTVDILTNDVSVLTGDAHEYLSGDVAHVVTAGTGRTVLWHPTQYPSLVTGAVARVTAWEVANPPDYLVLDLTMPNHRWYYARIEDLPFGGVTNVIYKTDRLVMRKIPAKDVVWRMGQPYPNGERCDTSNDCKVDASVLDNETGHMVKLTADYYMAIYETTRRQYQRMINGDAASGSVYGTYTYGPAMDGWVVPAAGATYNDLTGSRLTSFRTFTGLTGLNLPTEAQWEYACRAGTGTTLNNGTTIRTTRNWADSNAAVVAWYGNNYGTSGGQYIHPVGLKQPNAFGLYDMHGNVLEFCRDLYLGGDAYRATFVSDWQTGGVTIDPLVTDSALTEVVARGGDYFYASTYARSAARVIHPGKSVGSQHYGFRLICTLPVE